MHAFSRLGHHPQRIATAVLTAVLAVTAAVAVSGHSRTTHSAQLASDATVTVTANVALPLDGFHW